MRRGLWIALGVTVAAAVGVIATSKPAPERPWTYGDVAYVVKRDCNKTSGGGEWRPSLGISIDRFCEVAGARAALDSYRRDNPGRDPPDGPMMGFGAIEYLPVRQLR